MTNMLVFGLKPLFNNMYRCEFYIGDQLTLTCSWITKPVPSHSLPKTCHGNTSTYSSFLVYNVIIFPTKGYLAWTQTIVDLVMNHYA